MASQDETLEPASTSPIANPANTATTSPTTNPTTAPTINPQTNTTSTSTTNPIANGTISPSTSPTTNPTVTPTTAPTAIATEQLVWKVVRAATVLQSAAEHWQHSQRRSASLRRHINRCSAVAAVVYKTSSCAVTVGTAAKVVGGVTAALGVVSRQASLMSVGSRMWRAGCVSKLAGLGGKVLAEIWERGFRETLDAYVSSISGFLQSVSQFRSALQEIELVMPFVTTTGGGGGVGMEVFAVDRFMPLLLLVCSEELFSYACHVVKLFISPQHYSAIYDFASMAITSFSSSSSSAASLPLSFLHEVESFHILSVIHALPKPVQVAATVLHVGKEVKDLASSFRSLHIQREDIRLLKRMMGRLKNASVAFTHSVRDVPLLNSLVVVEHDHNRFRHGNAQIS